MFGFIWLSGLLCVFRQHDASIYGFVRPLFCTKKVSRVFQVKLKDVFSSFKGFQGQWYFKAVSKKFKMCFKEVSRVFQESFKRILK